MSLNDKFGGLFLRGGVLYYTICAHTPETQKCVNFVNKCAVCQFFQESVYFFRKKIMKLFSNLHRSQIFCNFACDKRIMPKITTKN